MISPLEILNMPYKFVGFTTDLPTTNGRRISLYKKLSFPKKLQTVFWIYGKLHPRILSLSQGFIESPTEPKNILWIHRLFHQCIGCFRGS